jgi:hypothetical protein
VSADDDVPIDVDNVVVTEIQPRMPGAANSKPSVGSRKSAINAFDDRVFRDGWHGFSSRARKTLAVESRRCHAMRRPFHSAGHRRRLSHAEIETRFVFT